MSYLARPRVGFYGDDMMTNPSTGNNENVIHLLDQNNVELLNPPLIDDAELHPMSDVAYREWMTTLMTAGNPPDPTAADPGWAPSMPGYWNYYGDHLTTFGSAAVNSVWIEDEPDAAKDPLLGARVAFNAKLVDLDPADTFCSQLIAANFSVVGRAADGELVELLGGVPTTSTTRWLNFNRVHGAGTFQSVIPNEALRFVDEARAPDSPGLAALREGAAAGGGLLLRYCLYGMTTRSSIPEMYDAFQRGEFPFNPKFGSVLGTIGVWNGTDMATAPVGRILQQPGMPFENPEQLAAPAPPPAEVIKTHGDVERLHAANAPVPDETKYAGLMGPAAAVVIGDRVVLDLLTTFPEQKGGGDPFAKHDFGTVELLVDDGQPEPLPIGDVAYDRATYEAQAGVVELPLPDGASDRLAAGRLILRDAAGTVLLREIPVFQVETDDAAYYMDMERGPADKPVAAGSIRVRAFDRGEPVAEPFTLRVQLFADLMQVGVANSVDPLVVEACALGFDAAGLQTVEVPAGGEFDLEVGGEAAGCFKLRFLPPGMEPDDNPQFNVEFYANYRILPFHDYSAVPDEEITWDFVYREVFSYYGILYPIMSLIIPWGPDDLPNDPVRVAQFAAIMRQAVDRKYLGTALSMPITRELDEGKRRLVQRWCDLQPRPTPAP